MKIMYEVFNTYKINQNYKKKIFFKKYHLKNNEIINYRL